MSDILDSNGQRATPDATPEIIKLESGFDDTPEPAPAPENVVAMPAQELLRSGRIIAKGDRRAINLLFETTLDGNRVNLLLARIYVAAENAEREVRALGDKDVARIVDNFRKGQAGVTPDGASS